MRIHKNVSNSSMKPDVYDPRKYLQPGRDAIQATVAEKMAIFGYGYATL